MVRLASMAPKGFCAPETTICQSAPDGCMQAKIKDEMERLFCHEHDPEELWRTAARLETIAKALRGRADHLAGRPVQGGWIDFVRGLPWAVN